MALESATYVGDLVATNPLGSDAKSVGDDHLRLIKSTLRESFGGFAGAILVSGTDGGSANAYTLTPTTALLAYGAKMLVEFTPNATNTGASTLNISALGAKNIYSVGGSALTAGDLVSGCYYLAVYDGTQFRLLSNTKAYIDALAFAAALPSQASNSGKIVTTNGTAASWTAVKTVNSNSILGSGDIAITSGLTLLATLTPTAAANVDSLNIFSSTYDNYLIIGEGIKPASNDALLMRFAVAGAADTGSKYFSSGSGASATAATSLSVTGTATSAGLGGGFTITVNNANDASNAKTGSVLSSVQDSATPSFVGLANAHSYNAANAITGFRLFWNGGANFAAVGKVRVYGYSNS